jgi:hypothetical protein
MPAEQTSPALLTARERYSFRGMGGQRAICRLRLYTTHAIQMVVAVVTEIRANAGPSVTNSLAELANQICKEFLIEPTRFVLIEH